MSIKCDCKNTICKCGHAARRHPLTVDGNNDTCLECDCRIEADKVIEQFGPSAKLKEQAARIAELEAALRGLLAVSSPPKFEGRCKYCFNFEHFKSCKYYLAEQAAQKALGGE